MLLPDGNVLVYAHKEGVHDHQRFKGWLESLINGDEVFGLCDQVLTGFLRAVRHPAVFRPASTVDEALPFIDQLRNQPHAVTLGPGWHHWEIFARLFRTSGARDNLVPDKLAALAIRSGSECVTNDGDFAQFAGIRWRRAS